MTIWQLRNLFGFSGEPEPFDGYKAYLRARRLLGQSEFQIWRDWMDDVVMKQKSTAPLEQCQEASGAGVTPIMKARKEMVTHGA